MIEDENTRRNRRLNEFNSDGLRRHGESWGDAVAAVARRYPQGIAPQVMDQVVANPNGHQIIMQEAAEQWLTDADYLHDRSATPEQRQAAIDGDAAWRRWRNGPDSKKGRGR